MRTVSSAMLAKLEQAAGAEPIVVVKMEFESGTKWYADKDYDFGVNTCKGKILTLSTINNVLKFNQVSHAAQVNMTLDDTDDELHQLSITDLIERVNTTLYLTYPGMSVADSLVLIKGRTANPIWAEGDRTLSITIDTDLREQPFGYCPSTTQLPGLAAELAGQPWPIVFGELADVEGTCINQSPALYLQGDITTDSVTGHLGPFTTENFEIGVPQQVYMGGNHILTLTLQPDGVTVTFDWNLIIVSNVTIQARGSGGANVLWIDPEDGFIAYQYVLITGIDGKKMVNICTAQDENGKCTFITPWVYWPKESEFDYTTGLAKPGGTAPYEVLLPTANFTTIAETNDKQGVVETGWGLEPKQQKPAQMVTYDNTTGSIVQGTQYTQGSLTWTNPSISFVNTASKYVINSAPSTEVVYVAAEMSKNGNTGYYSLDPADYTINLDDTINLVGIGNVHCTTVSIPHISFEKYGITATAKIYAGVRSTLSANTADILKYCIDNFTNLTADTTTFAAVATKIAGYPSHCCIKDNADALTMANDIAFQARLGMVIRDDTVYLSYLSEEPTNDPIYIDNSSTVFRSIQFGYAPLDKVVTHYTAKWRIGMYEEWRSYIYQNNVDTFGAAKDEYTYSIYSNIQNVIASADFWGYRKSNSWRTAKLAMPFEFCRLEIFDILHINIPVFGTNAIPCVVHGVEVDLSSYTVNIDVEIASEAGRS